MGLFGGLFGKKPRPAGPTGFGFSSTAEDVTEGVDLSGKTALVTGVNSGLGKETMRVLAARGASVIGAARTLEKAEEACAQTEGDTTPIACELSDLSSVARCTDQVKSMGRPLDILVCNAGVMALPTLHQSNGIEMQFATNHLGHFLLVNRLLGDLAQEARIVILSSGAHFRAPAEGIQFDNLSGEQDYDGLRAYGQSKVANILTAKELTRRRNGASYTANALHPGIIRTNLGRNMSLMTVLPMSLRIIGEFKTIPQGAATTCYLAANPQAAGVSGKYYADCNEAEPLPVVNDEGLAKRLWEVSEDLVGAYL